MNNNYGEIVKGIWRGTGTAKGSFYRPFEVLALLVAVVTSDVDIGIFGGEGTDPTKALFYSVCKKIEPNAFINTMSTSRVNGCFYLRPRD